MDGIRGMQRFLQRAWRNLVSEDRKPKVGGELSADLERLLHHTVLRVTDDLESLRFNTAIAALIELNNAMVSQEWLPEQLYRHFVVMLAPFAPHFCEEIWELLGETGSISEAPWPEARKELARADTTEMPVQVNGKMRARFTVAVDASRDDLEKQALEQENVIRHLEGKKPRKVIVVPGRMVNIVI
jgi:leucyl-tRNA synthetase